VNWHEEVAVGGVVVRTPPGLRRMVSSSSAGSSYNVRGSAGGFESQVSWGWQADQGDGRRQHDMCLRTEFMCGAARPSTASGFLRSVLIRWELTAGLRQAAADTVLHLP
jgi:hypothetical protein